jgi:hypothetical protein
MMLSFKISLDSSESEHWTKESFQWRKFQNEIIGLGSLLTEC